MLDVEQGGIVVPSFLGKSVRTAIEMAQESGLDLDAVGSGLARQQSPASRITRSVGIAGDGEVRTVNNVTTNDLSSRAQAKPASRASRGVEGPLRAAMYRGGILRLRRTFRKRNV